MPRVYKSKDLIKFANEGIDKTSKSINNIKQSYPLFRNNLSTKGKIIPQITQINELRKRTFPKKLNVLMNTAAKKSRQLQTKSQKMNDVSPQLASQIHRQSGIFKALYRNGMEKFNQPFHKYKSLLHQQFDYKYIKHIAKHYPNFRMINSRLHAIQVSRQSLLKSGLPTKFFFHNMKINPKADKNFMAQEERLVKAHYASQYRNVKGSTLLKNHVGFLVQSVNDNREINPKKSYKVRTWDFVRDSINRKHPQHNIKAVATFAHDAPTHTLSLLNSITKGLPEAHYRVQTSLAKHHILPKKVWVDTLESQKSYKVAEHKKSSPFTKVLDKIKPLKAEWLQTDKNLNLSVPSGDEVSKIANNIYKQYHKSITKQHKRLAYLKKHNLLQRIGLKSPVKSKKEHSSNVAKMPHKKLQVTNEQKQQQKLSPKEKQMYQAKKNEISRN